MFTSVFRALKSIAAPPSDGPGQSAFRVVPMYDGGGKPPPVCRDLSLIHPVARGQVDRLQARLLELHARHECVLFDVFETYRSPERQTFVQRTGNSRARMYESAHQLGLAVDFVPKIGGSWSWAVHAREWDVLRREATLVGLVCNLDWDRAHVEHPAWRRVLPYLKPSGA